MFLQSLVIVFFAFASLAWAPTVKWLTPIITGCMVFLINATIVVGDKRMRPFDSLDFVCGMVECEIMNISRRHADINTLFGSSSVSNA
jgi:hypothetical protein